MQFDFTGKRVIVAGGSRGIGRSIALAFAASGADVSICARNAAGLERTRAELAAHGRGVHAMPCDLSQATEIAAYVPAAVAALGGLDVLVNNATGYGMADDEASWAASLTVDVMAAVRATHLALPHLEASRGAIVNISSGSGLNPSKRNPAYGAGKAAVNHYTRTVAAQLAGSGVRVNCVAPGSIEFPGGLWERRRTDDPTLYNAVLAACPAGRMGRPEEVANVVLFLASPLASWVTAQIVGVNGGQGL